MNGFATVRPNNLDCRCLFQPAQPTHNLLLRDNLNIVVVPILKEEKKVQKFSHHPVWFYQWNFAATLEFLFKNKLLIFCLLILQNDLNVCTQERTHSRVHIPSAYRNYRWTAALPLSRYVHPLSFILYPSLRDSRFELPDKSVVRSYEA